MNRIGQAQDDNHCFVCGKQNQSGLQLDFALEEDEVRCRLSIPAVYQGWQGIVHGGIVATLLDEVMAKAAHFAGITAVTAEITVQYKKPTPAERPLVLSGRVLEKQRRILITTGELKTSENVLLASARARFFAV